MPITNCMCLLISMSEYKTSIVIDNKTRNSLKAYGRKDQTYDDIIRDLLEQKNKKEA